LICPPFRISHVAVLPTWRASCAAVDRRNHQPMLGRMNGGQISRGFDLTGISPGVGWQSRASATSMATARATFVA